jgi:hypothetical protein
VDRSDSVWEYLGHIGLTYMASGSVTIRVRPLRVAFLVDPRDSTGLYRAIELNSILWGGSYNPIIPAYRRTPAKWESHRVRRLPHPIDIIDGYLNGFDPDLVVPVGTCDVQVAHSKWVIETS